MITEEQKSETIKNFKNKFLEENKKRVMEGKTPPHIFAGKYFSERQDRSRYRSRYRRHNRKTKKINRREV